MMRKQFLPGASLLALTLAAPAVGQTTEGGNQSDLRPVDEIIVTATLRDERLQDVPIAVTALSTDTLEKANVRDLRDLGLVSSSFAINNSNSESGGTTIRIRGVGTTGNNTGLESAVGIFLDGIYLSRPSVALGDLLDVEQIEVLRGPQGTLFGRNTSAGALNIRTAKPTLDRIEGYANATYGNFNLFNVQAGVSAPLVEDLLGVRLSGAVRQRDGFITSSGPGAPQSNDRDRFLLRGQLLLEPTLDLSIRLIADYSKIDENCCDPIMVQDTSLAALYPAVGLPVGGGVTASGPSAVDSLTSNSEGQRDRLEQWGISGQFEWQFGDLELVSITSYRQSVATPVANSDFTNLLVFSNSNTAATATADTDETRSRLRTFTQELRLAGSAFDGALDFLVGAYYLDERIREVQAITLGSDFQRYNSVTLHAAGITAFGPNPALVLAQNRSAAGDFANNLFLQEATNFSLFTNNTLSLTDRLRVNVGLRYSIDEKDGSFEQLSARSSACNATRANPTLGALPAAARSAVIGLACFPFAAEVNNTGIGTPREFDQTFEDEELIYTGKLTWEVSDTINSYISFTHGYKSGGFNLDPTGAVQVSPLSPPGSPQFASETVDAYEFGLKSQFFDRKLTANLAVFKQDLSDFQVLEFTGLQFITFNVPKAYSNGFELELSGQPMTDLGLNLGLTYTDARYPDDCAGDLPLTPQFATVRLLCGSPLTNVSEFVVVAGFDYARPITDHLAIGFNGNLRWESDRRTSTQSVVPFGPGVGTPDPLAVPGGTFVNPFDVQEANVRINLRAGIGAVDGLWRIEVFGDNITNELTRSTTFNAPLRGIASAGPQGLARLANFAEPRTYGVTVRTKF